MKAMTKTVHKNTLTFTNSTVKYVAHDGYKLELPLSEVTTAIKAHAVHDQVMNFIQEIADNGSEGTFLTGAFWDFTIDAIAKATGIDISKNHYEIAGELDD